MATFDLKKLSNLDKGIVGAGALALISLFLPWYGGSASSSSGLVSYSSSTSGWSTGYGLLGALLMVAAGFYVMALRAGAKVPKIAIGPAVIVLGAAVLGTLLVALRWLTMPSASSHVSDLYSSSYGPSAGIFIALIIGIVQVFCAYKLFRSSGEPLPWARSGNSSTGSET